MLQNVKQSAQLNAIVARATAGADAARAEVQAAADYLAFTMQKMHGGEFVIQIDHECAFALVRAKLERRS